MQRTLKISYEATKARLMEIINSVPYGNADMLADKLIQNGVFFLSEDTLKEFIQQAALNLLISANKASYLKVEQPNDTAQLQALWRTFGASVCTEQKVIGITLKKSRGKIEWQENIYFVAFTNAQAATPLLRLTAKR